MLVDVESFEEARSSYWAFFVDVLLSDEKPFKCNRCDSAFSRASDLNRHMKTHTDGRMRWSRKAAAAMLVNVYEGVRPEPCPPMGVHS